jgi:hypothetical protein
MNFQTLFDQPPEQQATALVIYILNPILHRQGSGASEQPPRSDSRLSDYSSALPDLESQLFDEEDGPLLFSNRFESLSFSFSCTVH